MDEPEIKEYKDCFKTDKMMYNTLLFLGGILLLLSIGILSYYLFDNPKPTNYTTIYSSITIQQLVVILIITLLTVSAISFLGAIKYLHYELYEGTAIGEYPLTIEGYVYRFDPKKEEFIKERNWDNE